MMLTHHGAQTKLKAFPSGRGRLEAPK